MDQVGGSGSRAAMSRKVLVLGGSGYLGQFLVEDLATTDQVRQACAVALDAETCLDRIKPVRGRVRQMFVL